MFGGFFLFVCFLQALVFFYDSVYYSSKATWAIVQCFSHFPLIFLIFIKNSLLKTNSFLKPNSFLKVTKYFPGIFLHHSQVRRIGW